MNTTSEVKAKPTLERRTRRQFPCAEKQRLLAEMDALPRGEKGAWLRRSGLYPAHLSGWRKASNETGTGGSGRVDVAV